MRGISAFVVAAGIAASPATAQVANGSFETGDFTGWTVNADATYVGTAAHGYTAQDGSYFANLGNVGCCGTISQTVGTAAGASYLLDYYLASNGTTPNYFSASWDGLELAGSVLSNVGTQPYTLYQFAVTGTGSDTITFTEQDDPDYLALDNVSLTQVSGAVPEPATWAMMLLGFGGIGFTMRRRTGMLARLA